MRITVSYIKLIFFPFAATPSILPATLFTIWFHRLHNRIATELAVINPCWEDEMLFQTARDINIAIANEITLYELLPTLLGNIISAFYIIY